MKRLLTLLILCVPIWAQNTKSPYGSAARQVTTVAALPPACSVGEVRWKTGTAAGAYFCGATNTWTGPYLAPDASGNLLIGTTLPAPAPDGTPVLNAQYIYQNGVPVSTIATAMAPTGAAYIASPPSNSDFQTDSLLALYDFTTRSGNRVYDLSGNGRHGTAANVSFTSQGAVFNGTSSRIAIPATVGNQQFTTIIVASGTGTSGFMWSETNSANAGTLVSAGSWSNNSYYRDASLNTAQPTLGACCQQTQSWTTTYHAYLMTYNGSSVTVTVLDIPTVTSTQDASAVSIAATNTAAIGARNNQGAYDLFWAGTIAYQGIWQGTFTTTQTGRIYKLIQAAMAARGVRLPVLALGAQSAGPNLVRQGVVQQYGQEPNVLHESGCLLVASPCFKMWYSPVTGNPVGGSNKVYSESTDGLTWSDGVSTGVPAQSSVIHVGSTYYLYTSQGGAGGAYKQLTLWTSPDGLNNWTNRGTVIAVGTGNDPDSGGVYNSSVSYDPVDGWKMVYECSTAPHLWWHGCTATSRDGITWTKSTLGPLGGWANGYVNGSFGTPYPALSGPEIHKVAGQYWIFGHTGYVPSDIYLHFWGDASGYATLHPSTAILARGTAVDEAGQYGQVADPTVVEVNGKTYIFYGANNDGLNGADYYNIKLVIADMPLAQFVTTTGGATATTP